jgi:hypothetical protein
MKTLHKPILSWLFNFSKRAVSSSVNSPWVYMEPHKECTGSTKRHHLVVPLPVLKGAVLH